MNCPHTWFSTELRGGRRLLRTRLRDLLRPAPRRGRVLAAAAALLALCAGALVVCRPTPAEESTTPVPVEEETAQIILRLSPAALGLEEGSLTLSEPFSVELGGTYYQYFDLLQGEDIVAEVSVDHSTAAVRLHPTASELTICLVEPDLPQGAIAFREALPALVERYTDMDPEGELTFFYLGDYLSQDFPSVWGFRAVQRRGDRWVVLDDWYQDQAEGQVFNRSFDLDGLFSYVPGTFRFPVSFPNPASRFYPELDQYARALAGGGDYHYSHMTLAAAHYFDPEDPEGMGFDGVAAYYCPLTLSGQPGWTDETPYSVYLHTTNQYTYLGRHSTGEAADEGALADLAADYFREMEAQGWYQALPVTTEGNYFSPESAVFTSDALHFSWELPDQNVGYNASLLFRLVAGGLAVYYRPAYEYYVATHGGVEPEGIEPGSGCLIEILAGPEDPYPTLPEGRELLTLGRWTDPRIPAGNGWYYLPVSDFTWYPPSEYWDHYNDVLQWLISRAVFTLY